MSKYWNRAAYMKRKRTCIFVLRVKLSDLLKLLQLNGYPNTFAHQKCFLSISIQLKLRKKIQISFLKPLLEYYDAFSNFSV